MDSPERDRPPVTSPAEDSPLTCYLNTLSPLEPVKAVPYSQRFTEINFASPPPVFKSPHLDLQRETSFMKREKIIGGGSVVYGESDSQPKPIMVPCSQKEVQLSSSDVNVQAESQLNPMPIPFCKWEDQWNSSLVDEYLVDPEEVGDSLNSLHAQAASDGPQFSQSGFNGTEKIIPKLDGANHVGGEAGRLKFSLEYEKKFPCRLLKVFESAVDKRNFESDANAFPELNSMKFNSHMEASNQSGGPHYKQYTAQVSQNVMLQTAGGPHKEWDGNYPQFLESLDSIEAYEGSAERSKISEGPAEDVDRNQRAIRRHLQFGATASIINNQSNPTKAIANSLLPKRFGNLKDLVPSSHIESIGNSSSGKPVSYHNTVIANPSFCPPEFVESTRNVGDLPVPDFTPSSLSSMARCVSMHSDMFASNNLAGYMSSQEKILTTDEGQNLENYSNINSVTAIAAKTNGHMGEAEQEMRAVDAASLPVAGRFEELNKEKSQRKRLRKKATDTSESEGCKRCNCKRSKCLKLYCECFAAGVYCVESCACTECFNKPEYEETVLDTRHQIESRNPLAFAPKIVKSVTDSPANLVEDGNRTTPSSARHKRGCNCKKSKCLKNYCECFQARVGCSDACRCEGCNNPFGQRTGAERWENPCHQKLDTKENVTADSIKAGRVQCSPNWEELANITHGTPTVSHQHFGAATSSSNPNAGNSSNVSQIDQHCGRSYQPLVCYPPWSCSPSEGMPPQELGCQIPPYGILKDGDTPEILRVASTPPKAIKDYSPNKKRISPPQHRAQGSRSSYLPSLRNGRKLVLQSMPTFPPLTPYSKSKDCFDGTEKDHRGGSSSSQ